MAERNYYTILLTDANHDRTKSFYYNFSGIFSET